MGGNAEEINSQASSAAMRQQWQQLPFSDEGHMSMRGNAEEINSQGGSAAMRQQLQQLPFSHEGHMSMKATLMRLVLRPPRQQ